MTVLLLVAVGGASAALLHHHLTRAVSDPKRILVLTIVTCTLLGFATAATPPQWFVGLVCAGFLGSLAPMTSIALLTVLRIRERRYRSGLLFLAAAVIGGIACTMFGFLLYSSGLTLYRKF